MRKEIKELKPLFETIPAENFRELINYSAEKYSDDDAFIIKHKKSRTDISYEHVSFKQFRDDINAFGTGLYQMGHKGKKVAIVASNRYEWLVTYFGVVCGLGIIVPLDKDLPYDELESSVIRSGSTVLVYDKAHSKIINELRENNNTGITDFICMDDIEDADQKLHEIKDAGYKAIEGGFTDYMEEPIDKDALAVLLFTSGTTSQAKAVMLSHHNIVFDVCTMLRVEDIRHGDVNMAFLPYHHTFGASGQFTMIAAGSTTTYCDGLKYLQKNIVEYKVSVFVCVPLLIESIYKRIMTKVKKDGIEKKLATGIKLSRFLLKLGIDKRRSIFKDIHSQLGGNLRCVISGASAMDPVAARGFEDFGINAFQGYGMTEASPCLASETQYEKKPGSIGRAMPGIEMAIDNPNEEGIGELIGRGPNVMLGYYNNDEETAKVIDEDGWLHTGDLAYVDEDGYIFICGRKKNVIVLKNGKNVYPEELETLIANLPYVEESMVYGQPRFNDGNEKDLALCVKIVYNKDTMKDSYGLTDPEKIEELVRKDIDMINETLPPYKQMLRLIVTDEPMIKTTTGKVKRFEEVKKL